MDANGPRLDRHCGALEHAHQLPRLHIPKADPLVEAAAGQKPAGYEAKEVAFVADVQQVDLKKQTVTLRGAKKTLTLKIKDPEQLKLISKGDQVEGVFAEAIAIAVVPAPAKAKK